MKRVGFNLPINPTICDIDAMYHSIKGVKDIRNVIHPTGNTLLHCFCNRSKRSEDMIYQRDIQFLLDQKADVDVTNNDGCTPLSMLLVRQTLNYDVLFNLPNELITHANINVKNKYGQTPLMLGAANSGFLQAIIDVNEETDVVLDVDVNAVDENGNTALHYLCESIGEFSETVGYFKPYFDKNPTLLNTPNNEGKTPLQELTESIRGGLLEMLITHEYAREIQRIQETHATELQRVKDESREIRQEPRVKRTGPRSVGGKTRKR